MTDAEIVKHLAEKVMGWEVQGFYHDQTVYLSFVKRFWQSHPTDQPGYWNPLESIADAFEVQAAVLAGKNAHRYILRMNDLAYNGAGMIGTDKLCRVCLSATPRQRCLAMVAATSF